jgi:hypothetical protein
MLRLKQLQKQSGRLLMHPCERETGRLGPSQAEKAKTVDAQEKHFVFGI